MKEAKLKVAKAYPNDSGRDIARLEPYIFVRLDIEAGDIIEIEGNDVAAAKVWHSDSEDPDEDIVRIDGFTRSNADADLGEKVTVRKAETADAKKVVLAPPEGASVQFESGASDMVKRQILKRPIVQGNVVPVMSSTNHPSMRSPGQAIPLIAAQAEPDGTVMMTEDTEVVLREYPNQPDEMETKEAEKIVLEPKGGLDTELYEDEVCSYRDRLLGRPRPVRVGDEISIDDSLFVVLETEPEEVVRPTERTDIVFDSGDSRIVVSGISIERQQKDTENEDGT
jgi:transitional endoplasmic reticulum ATPase